MELKKETMVKLKDNDMTRAWGHANKIGFIIGPDPDGNRPDVYQVTLSPNKPCIFEVKGLHKNNFAVCEDNPPPVGPEKNNG